MTDIASIIINRGAPGPQGLPGVGLPGPQGARGPAGGSAPGQLGAVFFGGSQDARNHYELDAAIAIAGGVATLNPAVAPLVHDGARVSIGQSNPQTAVENLRRTGRLTRVGSQTFTLAVPGAANGSGTTKIRFLDHWAPAAYARHMNDALGNAISVLANMAQGGERTLDALNRYLEVDAFNPDCVLGSWNLGNDIDGSTTPANTLSRVDQMLTHFTDDKGYLAVMYGPPCIPQLDAPKSTIGRKIMDGIVRRRMRNPNFLWHDTYAWTVLPGLGYGDAALFEKPDGIHWNQDSGYILGNYLAALLFDRCGALPDSLVQSIWDDVGADPLSGQIAPGFWSTSGVTDASLQSARATGSILPGFNAIQISAGAGVDFTVEDEPDGFGKLQRMKFQGPPGSQFSIDYVGAANAMASRLQLGQIYDPGHGFGLTLSAPGVLGDWEVYAGANLTYPSGAVNARLSSWMRVGTYENPARRSNLPYAPIYYPYFLAPATATATNLVRFTQTYTLALDGFVVIDFARPTMRQRETI